jgi:hypothetical protein
MNENLVTSEIIRRKETYYLTTASEIDSIKSKGVFSDIFLAFFSLFAGGALTIFITLRSDENLGKELTARLSIISAFLLIVAVVFFLLYISFSFQIYKTIKGIKLAGEYTSQEAALDSKIELKILEAAYFSLNRSTDVTEKLQGMIVDNVLVATATNDLFGDPEPGKDKWLKIKYSLNRKEFAIQYDQGGAVQIPQNKPIKT